MKMVNKVKGYVKFNSPTILTCLGAAGVVGTAVLAAKAGTKASKVLELAEKEKGEKLTTLEKIDIALPAYIPTVMVGAATITCIFGANVINKRKQASLVSAYGLLDQTYKEYRKKVEDYYGEGSDEEILDEIAKDNFDPDATKPSEGTELFYDEYSKRYFTASPLTVSCAEYQLNRDLQLRDYAYLNEFYEMVGLDPIEDGWTLGWSVGACLEMYWQNWIDFGHRKITLEDGSECTAITIFMDPIVDFEEYF